MSAATASQATLSQQVDFTNMANAAAGQNISNLPVTASVAVNMPSSGQPITVMQNEMTSFLNAPLPGCATVTPTSVTYTDCDFASSAASGYGSAKLNGMISRSGNVVTWDLKANWNYQGTTGGSFTLNWHATGSLTVTDSAISGSANVDYDGTISGNYHADVDVHYQKNPSFCINSGTLYVRRTASYGGTTIDGAARLTWMGCGVVQVQN